jgi:hypothetical protein
MILRAYLDLDDRRDTINDLVETQHSINVIFLVLYEHSEKRFENKLLSLCDWFAFHNIICCLDSVKSIDDKTHSSIA